MNTEHSGSYSSERVVRVICSGWISVTPVQLRYSRKLERSFAEISYLTSDLHTDESYSITGPLTPDT